MGLFVFFLFHYVSVENQSRRDLENRRPRGWVGSLWEVESMEWKWGPAGQQNEGPHVTATGSQGRRDLLRGTQMQCTKRWLTTG